MTSSGVRSGIAADARLVETILRNEALFHRAIARRPTRPLRSGASAATIARTGAMGRGRARTMGRPSGSNRRTSHTASGKSSRSGRWGL